MTNIGAQHLLAFLGFYGGECDGIWGPKSKDAMTRFQEAFGGIAKDGLVTEESGNALRNAVTYMYDEVEAPVKPDSADIWASSEYFGRSEFRCMCGKYCNGFPVEPDPDLVRFCNEFRRRLGVPVTIVDSGGSGIRCQQHNAAVGGATNSNHLYGKAADLHSSKSPQEMQRIAEEILGNTGELGLYKWGIHVAVNCRYSRFTG